MVSAFYLDAREDVSFLTDTLLAVDGCFDINFKY